MPRDPNPRQISITQISNGRIGPVASEFEPWDFPGVWCLGFGISALKAGIRLGAGDWELGFPTVWLDCRQLDTSVTNSYTIHAKQEPFPR